MISEIIPQIAGLADSIIDVCNSDTDNKAEVVEVLAQKIGYLCETALIATNSSGYKPNTTDWFSS